MKRRIYTQLFAISCLVLMFASCSNEVELNILDSEVDRLTLFVDEANSIAAHYDDLKGPKGAEIFGNNKSATCGNEHIFIGPCLWAIDDIVTELGYRDIGELNKWMLDAGVVLYDIKMKNKEFDNQTELVNEIACLIAPEIITRSQDKICYKDNLIALLNGALNGGNSHSTNYYNNQDLTKEKMYEVGSSMYKVWRYMVNSKKCN